MLTLILKGEIKPFPSYQGFLGAINTPNSEVLREGELQLLKTNQIENFYPKNLSFRDNKQQENYFINMGILPNLDVSLRYSYAQNIINNTAYLSDRIINFKYKIPFIPNDIFSMAFGMQDIGGKVQHLSSSYIVFSKELYNIRSNIGYAKGIQEASLDGIFGSIEYQPFSWLQIAGEYDTHEWNGVLKYDFNMKFKEENIHLGAMLKSSLTHKTIYTALYGTIFFKKLIPKNINILSLSKKDFKNMNLDNTSYHRKGDTLYFEYENTLYSANDIDALGMVLANLTQTTDAKKVVITVKKNAVSRFNVSVETQKYLNFIKTGIYPPSLFTFSSPKEKERSTKQSNRFKPTITIQPDFVFVDGSEYGHLDYTFAMQSEISFPIAKGLTLSGRYNLPLSSTNNFKKNGIFDYRNRNKTSRSFDQILLTQFFQTNLSFPFMNILQIGRFDHKLEGLSFESAINSLNGKHLFLLKLSYLKDELYKQIDFYSDTKYRNEKLLSYRYYLDNINSDLKITIGEYLYGDRGVNLQFKRYFSDISIGFDLSKTKHPIRGTNTVGKLTLSIPFGMKKQYKTDYFNIKGGNLSYERRKTVTNQEGSNLAQPLHLKEIDNSFTLENYYLDRGHLHPAYIKSNHQRLRSSFLEETTSN